MTQRTLTMEKTMNDVLFWVWTAVFLAILIWAFWPKVASFLRITANEGDELMADAKKLKKAIKTKLK